jgi:hypothetical protein
MPGAGVSASIPANTTLPLPSVHANVTSCEEGSMIEAVRPISEETGATVNMRSPCTDKALTQTDMDRVRDHYPYDVNKK